MSHTISRAVRVRLSVAAIAATALGAGLLAPSVASASGTTLVVPASGVSIDETTRVSTLVIENGGTIDVPDGKRLTITVNGVEVGQQYTSAAALVFEPELEAGTYTGHVVLTVADANDVSFQGFTWPFRQALYVDADGVQPDKSVGSMIRGGSYDDDSAEGISITSKADGSNGIVVDGGEYTVSDSTFSARGEGRNDFAGMGATLRSSGADTRLTVDDVDIDNVGALRTAIVATDGSDLVVKDSTITTEGTDLPDDYVFGPPPNMRQAPWMLGIVGNVRATNMLGNGTRATYVNSSVHSSEWGALSTDGTSNSQLTAIDSDVSTGEEGYGSYADGQSVAIKFYGTKFDVDDYGIISTGGDIELHDSSAANVAALDDQLDLRLTDEDKATIEDRATTVDSSRFGIMWHGGGSADIDAGVTTIDGGTRLHTGETTFQNKGHQLKLDVDGSDGASITSDNGVLFQLMEADDPGFSATAVYHDPTDAIVKNESFDTTTSHTKDSVTNLTDVDLDGDFYNALRNTAKNLVLNLKDSSIDGVISASTVKHRVDAISMANYQQIGEVDNTVGAAVNNGVVVNLQGDSTWTVAGESHVTALTIGSDARVVAPSGKKVTMTVDGVATPIEAGHTYAGDVVLTASAKDATATKVQVTGTTYGTAATVKVTVPNATGSVTLKGAGVAKTASLSGGVATFSLPRTLVPGSYALTASYAGTSTAAASAGTATLKVAKGSVAGATVKVTKVPTSKAKGAAKVTLTAPAGLLTPSGKVTVKLTKGGTVRTATVTVKSGRATLTLPKLAKGSWKVVATYSGDARYVGKSVKTSVTVRR